VAFACWIPQPQRGNCLTNVAGPAHADQEA
jgi:hypothetical protein